MLDIGDGDGDEVVSDGGDGEINLSPWQSLFRLTIEFLS